MNSVEKPPEVEPIQFYKYDVSWVGIDSGREGLWNEPIWSKVLQIISAHGGEPVYGEDSPIYHSLERHFPRETWRARQSNGLFRPLFRDYPNPWTRTRVLDLSTRKFNITPLGTAFVCGSITKEKIFVNMFREHAETSNGAHWEKPFPILARGFIETPRSLSTDEVYWALMKNYRPGDDDLAQILKVKLPKIKRTVETTPYRRVRNMLALMRSVGAIESTRRGSETYWRALDPQLLTLIAD